MNVAVVHFRPGLDAGAYRGDTVVAIDVLRATTTIVTALAHGAREVLPRASIDECLHERKASSDDPPLLAGEVANAPIPGFDLGNSPLECAGERVAGRRIVLRTTNGTQVLAAFGDARRVVCAAFVNLAAVVETLASEQHHRVTLVCAGQDGAFSLEDALCAGAIAVELSRRASTTFDDAARAAALAYDACQNNLHATIRSGTHARDLITAGFADDIAFATRLDVYGIVPTLTNGRLTSARPSTSSG